MDQTDLRILFDDFETELTCVSSLINMLYAAPDKPDYQSLYTEQLHTHLIELERLYQKLRPVIMSATV